MATERLRDNQTTPKDKSKLACSIIITCYEPENGDEMDVSMNYEGDPCLASCLLHDALNYVDQILEKEPLEKIPSLKLIKK
ncbi:hypothetical protein N9Y92_01690 [Chlamydiales bacterium]|nr:hypothetical protein [Chlamydiales bacterium]